MSLNTHAHMGFTQFELSKLTLKNLNKFKLSPTGKLVLLALVDCYNPNNEEIFPKQQTLADELGISPSSVKRGIKELADAKIIIYEFKSTNRYRLTSTFYSFINIEKPVQKGNMPQSKLRHATVQKDPIEGVKLSFPYIEQKKEQKKNTFKQGYNGYNANVYTPNEPKHISTKETRKLLDKIEKDKKTSTSPYDNKECAIAWLNSLDENSLKHSFIKERVDKVKKIWNLD